MLTINDIKSSLWKADRYFSATPLRTKWLYLRREVLRRFNPVIPRQLWIGVTYRCQCQCIHCCLGPLLNKEKDELTRREIFQLIETARHLGFMEVSYFGGEPLLREDLTDLIRFSSSRGLLSSIYTNGIRLTREKAKELRKAGLFFCNISLDSSSPEIHNQLRRSKECFEKAVDGIRYLTELGVRCSIWTYVKKSDIQDDLQDLKSLIGMARRLEVRKVVILFPMASGNWLCGAESMLTLEERERVRPLHSPPFSVLEFPREDAHCNAGRRMVYVTPQGDVSPCPTVPHFFGNIRREALPDILKKLNTGFVEGKVGGCGECVMNHHPFREKIGVDVEWKEMRSPNERRHGHEIPAKRD
ncbi:MAG: radical SAM protein [Nitrospirae bacterium]|nr:radical SAM protein [Nitrospirota bacterium]